MSTRLVVRILVILLQVGVCFLAMPLFLGRVKSWLVSRSHQLSLNIGLCRLLVLKFLWLRGLLGELSVPQLTNSIQIAANPVFHERTKHIEVDCHSIRESFAQQEITLPHISTKHQTADVFTKALFRPRHQFLIDKLMLLDRPASI
jgi:hypothetical protein